MPYKANYFSLKTTLKKWSFVTNICRICTKQKSVITLSVSSFQNVQQIISRRRKHIYSSKKWNKWKKRLSFLSDSRLTAVLFSAPCRAFSAVPHDLFILEIQTQWYACLERDNKAKVGTTEFQKTIQSVVPGF